MHRVIVPTLLLVACTGGGAPARAPGRMQLPVRLAEARHADQVELDIFVWPAAAPTEAPSEDACMWWSGDRRGRDFAKQGLGDGSLHWAALVVTREGIGWSGEQVVTLDGVGRLPEDQVRDGAIPALSGVLRGARTIQDTWYEACGLVYRDRPLLVVDQAVPASTVLAVLRTLSLNRFHRTAALVGDRQPENRGVDEPADPGVLVIVRPTGEQVEVMDSHGMIRNTAKPDQIEGLLAKAAAGKRFGCTLIAPEATGHWRDVVGTIDATTAFGARTALVHSEAPWSPGPEAPVEDARAPSEWLTLDGRAAVHWLDTPDVVLTEGLDEEVPVTCDSLQGEVRQSLPQPVGMQLALTTIGKDPLRPCIGQACTAVMQPLPEDLAEQEPVTVGWSAQGRQMPDPEAEDGPWAPLVTALKACPAPEATPGRVLTRAVGWLEIDPAGKPFDAQVSTTDASHEAWARCVGAALREAPPLPPREDGRYTVAKVWVDAVLTEASEP